MKAWKAEDNIFSIPETGTSALRDTQNSPQVPYDASLDSVKARDDARNTMPPEIREASQQQRYQNMG